MSITPLISGTPGTRYSTLVARAVSAVQSKRRAADAHSEEVVEDTADEAAEETEETTDFKEETEETEEGSEE